MLPTDALKHLANYAGMVPGLNASYPPTNRIKLPHLMVWFDATDLKEGGEQTWLMTARGQLLNSVKGGDLQTDLITVERFFAPLADMFSVNNPKKDAYHLRDQVTGDQVDFCQLSRFQPGNNIEWLGSNYYGAELFWNIKLRRFRGST